jgi:hypothetical protein
MSRLRGVPLSSRLCQLWPVVDMPGTQLDALEQTLHQVWSVPVDALRPGGITLTKHDRFSLEAWRPRGDRPGSPTEDKLRRRAAGSGTLPAGYG